MTETEFTQYFQQLAQESIFILDSPTAKTRRFARLEEVWDGLRANIDASSTMLMIVKNEQGTIEGAGHGNLVETQQCGFMLVKKCRIGDFQQYQNAYDTTLSVARKIVGRMAKDKKEQHPLMTSLRIEGLQFSKLGPIFGDCYGYEVSFAMAQKNACDYKYLESEWTGV